MRNQRTQSQSFLLKGASLAVALFVAGTAWAGFADVSQLEQIQSADKQWQSEYLDADEKEFLIKLKSPVTEFNMNRSGLMSSLEISEVYEQGNFVIANMTGSLEALAEQIAEIAQHEEVEYIVPNLQVRGFDFFLEPQTETAPNDPDYSLSLIHI